MNSLARYVYWCAEAFPIKASDYKGFRAILFYNNDLQILWEL